MISLDLMKSSEVRKAGDRSNCTLVLLFVNTFIQRSTYKVLFGVRNQILYHEWQFSFHLTNVLYMYYNRRLTEFVSAIVQKSYNGIPIPYTNMIDILGWNVKIVMSFSQPQKKSGKLHMNHVVGSIWTRCAGIATSAMPPNYYFVV